MKVVKKEEREMWETETTKIYEYPFHAKNIDCAVAEINGRYPLSGYIRNTECDEMVYCKSGNGEICFENQKTLTLKEDDAILINKNEWYYWTNNTNGVFVPMCNPAWSTSQVERKEF